MTTKNVTQKIIDTAKAQGADFCEVVVTQNEFSLKRIKQGQVDQPPAGEQWAIDVAITKGKTKKAATFDNPIFAQQIVKETIQQMKLLPNQEVFIPKEVFTRVAQPQTLYDKKTAQLSDKYLIDIAQRAAKKLAKENLHLHGKIAQGRGEITYQNSIGTVQSAQFTVATAGLYAFDRKDEYISAYASSGGISVDHIEQDRLVEELITKCQLQRENQRIDLFADKKKGDDLVIDVILEPYVVADILNWLGFFMFNGLLVQRGESILSGALGKQLMGNQVTITDDPDNSASKGMGFPFDFEGRPRKKVSLIENGIAKNAAYDTQLAQESHTHPTGSALPPSQRSEGAAPFNLTFAGENSTIQQMIEHSKRPTLWITKSHYLAMKHSKTTTMTGIAHHGVFLVENGKVQAPVENLRFEENISEAFSRIQEMSKAQLVFDPHSLSFPTATVVPTVKINQFRFIGSTKRTT